MWDVSPAIAYPQTRYQKPWAEYSLAATYRFGIVYVKRRYNIGGVRCMYHAYQSCQSGVAVAGLPGNFDGVCRIWLLFLLPPAHIRVTRINLWALFQTWKFEIFYPDMFILDRYSMAQQNVAPKRRRLFSNFIRNTEYRVRDRWLYLVNFLHKNFKLSWGFARIFTVASDGPNVQIRGGRCVILVI